MTGIGRTINKFRDKFVGKFLNEILIKVGFIYEKIQERI